MSDVIAGLKLIRHNAGRVNNPDDESYPFKLEATFRPPEFMEFAFIGLYGGREEIVVRGMTKQALDEFAERNGLKTHSRLRTLTVTGPEGVLEEISKET